MVLFLISILLLSNFVSTGFSGGSAKKGHIPFRDSKLTRILQHSLGGNARTAIICTMSPAHSHVEQSRNTLAFATRAKEVTNTTHINMVRFCYSYGPIRYRRIYLECKMIHLQRNAPLTSAFPCSGYLLLCIRKCLQFTSSCPIHI